MSAVVQEASLSDSPLSVDRLLALVADPEVGGIALFVGVVRVHDHGSTVRSLDYSQHPDAGRTLRECAERVGAAHDVLRLAIQHRVGHLQVGDLAVVIAVGAVHRTPALAACADLIDTVKVEVPIWKEQVLVSGASTWVGLSDAAGTDR